MAPIPLLAFEGRIHMISELFWVRISMLPKGVWTTELRPTTGVVVHSTRVQKGEIKEIKATGTRMKSLITS